MKTQTKQLWVIGVAMGIAAAGTACGGSDLECGPGATERDGRCVASIGSCGAGTVLRDGNCAPECTEDEYWNGSKCTSVRQCAPGTWQDGGACVPECVNETYWDGQSCTPIPTCAAGTAFDADAGACAPTEELCAAGTHFESGQCVPDSTQCGTGTHLDNGACVPDKLPASDVTESADPEGDAPFDLPAAGDTVRLGGTVDTPTDLDGDGMPDPDYDRFTFEGTAGTWLKLHATSEGAAHPAIVVVSEARDADGFPLYSRYSLNPSGLDTEREVYLPFDGAYSILISDYNHIVADLYGWSMLPIGGDDFTYQVVVENLGTPSPKSLTATTATETGTVAGGALHFYQLDALALHDVRRVTNVGVPTSHVYSDVFAGLMVFDPSGALIRHRISYATDEDASSLFAATTAGDYLVVQDHLMTIGDRIDDELTVVSPMPVNCGTADCSTGALPAGQERLLRWNVVAGDLFAAGLSLSSTATTTVDIDLLDESLLPIATTSSATKYGPAKALYYGTKSERVYLRIVEHAGAVVDSYAIDDRVTATQLLASGSPYASLPVIEMPAATYPNAGYGHVVAAAGTVLVSAPLAVSGPNWTTPVEEYLSPGFDVLGPALDTTASTFPSSAMAPLFAYVPVAGHVLHRARDGANADITGETYGTTLFALTATDLGTPTLAQSSTMTNQALHASAGLAVLKFQGTVGPHATVTVTPKAGAGLQPELWVATPGASLYASSKYSWVPDAAAFQLGVVGRGAAGASGDPVSVQIDPKYDDIHIIMVRDAGGAAMPADRFDITIALAN